MPTKIAHRIVVDAEIRSGKPVIEGTRVPVELILAKLANGMTSEEISSEYDLTIEDIQSALAYAVHN